MKGFRFKYNHANLKKLTDAQRKAIEATGEKMIADKIRSQEIPFLEGTLQNISTRVDKPKIDKGFLSIVHEVPYAKRLYYHPEYNFTKLYNINAKGEWWEDFLTGDKKEKPRDYYAVFIKRFSKGVIK